MERIDGYAILVIISFVLILLHLIGVIDGAG